MAREATQAELLAVYEADGGDVSGEALAEALKAIRLAHRDECHWARVELPELERKGKR